MKLKTSILFGLIMCSTFAVAQNLNLDILPPTVTFRQDSAVVTMKLTVSVPEMDPKSQIRLTPILSDNNHNAALPQIVLNGERAQRLYRRTLALKKRKGKAKSMAVFIVIALDGGKHTIDYRSSIPVEDWIQQAEFTIRKEIINGNGDKVQSEIIPIPNKENNFFTTQQDGLLENPHVVPLSTSIIPELRPVSSDPTKDQTVTTNSTASGLAPSNNRTHFKGSYVSPQSDATDERNQKELNFSLDEARVIAEINPQMLSLRELYTVALSYKNNPAQFYKVIDISVKIYPASPIANLNAAAAAIERGNIQAAGRYLQMSSHESLAYKNCRGSYELLCNNTYEGIRLLKAAKAEGSEEASYNLKLFFELNQKNVQ